MTLRSELHHNICSICGLEITDDQISSGFNIGLGPVYTCKKCNPIELKTTQHTLDFFDQIIKAAPPPDNDDDECPTLGNYWDR